MKKVYVSIILVFLCGTVFAAQGIGFVKGVQLTKEQFDNLTLISNELKLTHPELQYFNGSMDNMIFEGMDQNVAKSEINAMNIEQLKKKDIKRLKLKKLRNKLKILGLDDEDLETLGLKSDISDV